MTDLIEQLTICVIRRHTQCDKLLRELIDRVDSRCNEVLILDLAGGVSAQDECSGATVLDCTGRISRPLWPFVANQVVTPYVLIIEHDQIVSDAFLAQLEDAQALLATERYRSIAFPLVRLSGIDRVAVQALGAGPLPEGARAEFTGVYQASLIASRYLSEWEGSLLCTRNGDQFRSGTPILLSDAPVPRLKLVFGLLVHEAPAVVRDQIRNIQHVFPGARIILHTNREFHERYPDEEAEIGRMPDVLINPQHLQTGWATTGLALAMTSNLKLACERIAFDYYVMNASNDLYVRPGAEAVMARHDAGSMLDPLQRNASPQSASARHDAGLKRMARSLGGARIFVSGHEGMYFRQALCREMLPWLEKFVAMDCKPATSFGDPQGDYGKEEYYFSTLVGALTANIGEPLIYRDFAAWPSITPEHVNNVMQRDFSGLPFARGGEYFGVKRVARRFDDATRRFIRDAVGHAEAGSGLCE